MRQETVIRWAVNQAYILESLRAGGQSNKTLHLMKLGRIRLDRIWLDWCSVVSFSLHLHVRLGSVRFCTMAWEYPLSCIYIFGWRYMLSSFLSCSVDLEAGGQAGGQAGGRRTNEHVEFTTISTIPYDTRNEMK